MCRWVAVTTAIMGCGEVCLAADPLLSPQQLAECATGFADALRAWPVVVRSAEGVDLASPVLVVRRELASLNVPPTAGAIIRAMHLRLGAKVRFVRRDAKDPPFLPLSQRFDYETRLLLTPADPPSDGRLRLVLELYEPAGSSPVFSVDYPFSPPASAPRPKRNPKTSASADPSEQPVPPPAPRREQDAAGKKQTTEKRSRDQEKKRKEAKKREEEKKRQKVRKREEAKKRLRRNSEKFASENIKRVVAFELGHVYLKDNKTASRLAVITEGSRRLPDGRLEVQVTLVCVKRDRKVEINTAFYNGKGECAEVARRIKYEFEERRPHTVRMQSNQPAVRFVMVIEKD